MADRPQNPELGEASAGMRRRAFAAALLTVTVAGLLMPSLGVGSTTSSRCSRVANQATHHGHNVTDHHKRVNHHPKRHHSKGKGSYGHKRTGAHKRVTLAATGPASPINMGNTKGIGETDIVVGASPALPPTVRSKQITLTVPKRFERSGSNMTSQYLPAPGFSPPRILENGKLVAFTLCVDVDGAEAGSYVGQVIVGGPKGVQPATIAITVNAKNQTLFHVGVFFAAMLALLLLFFQAAKKKWDGLLGPNEASPKFGDVMKATLKDVWGFWVPTLIAVVAAVVAVFQVWDSAPAWGADTGASLIALGGTTLSAIGIGGFLTSIRGSS